MAWVSLTEADVRTRLSSAEVAALNAVHVAAGDTQTLPRVIAQVVDEVRGYIAATGNTDLEDGAKIPGKLVGAALALIRYRLISSLPNQSLITEPRKQEYNDAIRLLERVADGKFRVEEPVVASTESIKYAGPKITGKTRRFGRDVSDGI